MRTTQEYIAQRQVEFSRHAFFARLRADSTGAAAVRFVPRLAFWVMAFQDILRLNEQRISEPMMRSIARHHRAEDSGHDRWFLGDLAALGIEAPDLPHLFGAAHATTRDAAYALVAEVFRADSDHERMILLLCLEAAGHVFFEASASYFERVGVPQAIRYFSRHHIEIEKDHEMFEQRMKDFLGGIVLSAEERQQGVAMVGRIHAAFITMFDGLLTVLDRVSQRPLARSEAPAP